MRAFIFLALCFACVAAYAMTCDETGRVCTETTVTNVTTIYNIDTLVARKKWLKARNSEIDESIERDTVRYVTEPTAEKTRNTAEIATISEALSSIAAAGGNVTEEYGVCEG